MGTRRPKPAAAAGMWMDRFNDSFALYPGRTFLQTESECRLADLLERREVLVQEEEKAYAALGRKLVHTAVVTLDVVEEDEWWTS